MYGILWSLSMPSDSPSQQHVVAYAFSVKLATLKIDDFYDKSGLYRVKRESLNNMCDTNMSGTLWASLHGGVVDPWVYEILRQMFRGGLTFCFVFIFK